MQSGNLVKANDAALVTINQIAPIYVTFAVPERELPEIRRRQNAGTLVVEAEEPASGRSLGRGDLTFVDNAVDPTTGHDQAEGDLPERRPRLWPGQFVNVVVTLTTDQDAIVVPSARSRPASRGPTSTWSRRTRRSSRGRSPSSAPSRTES